MGSWGHGIMDGDTPMDCKEAIVDILFPDRTTEVLDPEITASILEANADKIVAKISTLHEPHIGFMVLGQIAVNARATLSREHRGLILKAIQEELDVRVDSEGWRDPHERKMHVRKLATELGLGGPMADDIEYLKLKMLYDQVQERIAQAIPRMPGKNALPGAILTALVSIQSWEDLKNWGVIAHELRSIVDLLRNPELENLPIQELTGTALKSVMETWKKSNESS